jgi:DNA-binding transcriptional LysR family regulator
MDRFASITAFVRVTESGGFSAAGRRLNLSKATVSDQVQALENALGVRLLNRTTRRVSLTEIGRGYYERCVQLLQDLEEADEAAGAQQATPRGQLRIYCQQGMGRFAAPVVVDFLARYPGSVSRSAHRPRDDRPGTGGVRSGDQPIPVIPAPRRNPCQTAPGDGEPYVVLRPGLSRKTSGAAIPGRPRRP